MLALLPIVAFAYLVFPQLYSTLAGAAGLFLVFGLVTAVAHFCRWAGRRAEKQLYSSWGGRPTTIMLRHRDSEIDSITKRRYHDFLARNISGWVAPSAGEEAEKPEIADQAYDSAVRWLLEHTRDKNQYAMLFKENISYGFRRNCYGIKWLAVAMAWLPVLLVIGDAFIGEVSVLSLESPTLWVSMFLSLGLFFWWAFVVNAQWVKDAAEAYALRLLSACELI